MSIQPKISIGIPIEKHDEDQVYNSYLPPIHAHVYKDFQLGIQGMVAHPTALNG